MGFCGYLKQSTAVDILLGPFIADTDGKTAETGLTIDVELSKNGQALADSESAAPTHDSAGTVDGYYNCVLGTTDTGTLGILSVVAHAAGFLPVHQTYQIVTANWYDTMCSTDNLDVNVTAIANDVITPASVDEDADFTIQALTITNALTTGSISNGGTTTLTGNVSMGGTFDVVGAASAASVSIDAGFDVVGALSANSLLVDTTTTLTGNVSLGGTLGVTGATTLTGGINAGAISGTLANDIITAASINTGAFSADAFAANALAAATFASDCITSDKIADDAIGDEHWNVTRVTADTDQIEGGDATDAINAACDAAIETYKLDHLIHTAAAEDEVADNSVIARLAATEGDWSEYNDENHSLEAIRVRGDAEWPTATGFATEVKQDVIDGIVDELKTAIITNAAGVDVSADIAALNDLSAANVTAAVWDAASALTLDFGSLVERVYQLLQNKEIVDDATGAVALRTIGDGGDLATWSITDDDTTTIRTEASWV